MNIDKIRQIEKRFTARHSPDLLLPEKVVQVTDHQFKAMGGDERYQNCCHPVFADDPADSFFGLGGPMECGLTREEHAVNERQAMCKRCGHDDHTGQVCRCLCRQPWPQLPLAPDYQQ